MSCHFWDQIANNLPSGVCWTLWSCSVQATFGSKTCWSHPTKKKNMTKNVVSNMTKTRFSTQVSKKGAPRSLESSPFSYFFANRAKNEEAWHWSFSSGPGDPFHNEVTVIHPSFERCFNSPKKKEVSLLEVRECWFWWSQGTYTSSSGKSVLDLPVGWFRKELPTSFPIDNPRSISLVVRISVDHQLIWRISYFSWHLS